MLSEMQASRKSSISQTKVTNMEVAYKFHMNGGAINIYSTINKRSLKIGTLSNVGTFPFVYNSISRTYITLKPFIPQKSYLQLESLK